MRTATAAVVSLLVLSACGGGGGGRGAEDGSPPTTEDAGEERAEAGDNLLVEVRVDGTYPTPVLHVVRVEQPDGTQVFERVLGPDRKLAERLEPGQYRVLSYQRECQGSCDLDPERAGPPVDLCGSYFDVAQDRTSTAVVTVVAGEGCTIALS